MKKLILSIALLFSAAQISADCCRGWLGWPFALAGGWVVGPFINGCCCDCCGSCDGCGCGCNCR